MEGRFLSTVLLVSFLVGQFNSFKIFDVGVSRSCTIAVSFLMQKRGMSVEEALTTVKKNRDVHPNKGFLVKLIKLDEQLNKK